MIRAFSTPHNRIRSFILLGICGLLVIAAAVVGINDNPPGILLAFLAATAFILAFVHPWRIPRKFKRLFYASFVGLVAFGLLHNVIEVLASNLGDSGLVQALLNGAGTAFFLIATLLCPPGLLVGVVGAVIMSIRNRRQPTSGPTTTI